VDLEEVDDLCLCNRSARLSTSTEALEYQYAIFVEFQLPASLDGEVLPRAHLLAPTFSHRTHSDAFARVSSIAQHELDVRIGPIDPSEIPAFPVRDDRAHEVDVSPNPSRVVVPFETEVGEGALAVGIDGESCEPTLSKLEHIHKLPPDLSGPWH
jgi:hypothetical protein